MIIPCMNSTSAGDPEGNFPTVDAGSLLLGFPGAPGCTTTGPDPLFCWASADGQKKPAGPNAPSRPTISPTPRPKTRRVPHDKAVLFSGRNLTLRASQCHF